MSSQYDNMTWRSFSLLVQKWSNASWPMYTVSMILSNRDWPSDLLVYCRPRPVIDFRLLLTTLVKQKDDKAVVIMVTGYPSIDSAITSIKDGAYDYLVKPINIDDLKFKIQKGLERRKLSKSVSFLKGVNWSLIVSIPIWLILGIILAKSL